MSAYLEINRRKVARHPILATFSYVCTDYVFLHRRDRFLARKQPESSPCQRLVIIRRVVGARDARRPYDHPAAPALPTVLLQRWRGGGGGQPDVCLAPVMCLHAVPEREPLAFAVEPARACTILRYLHPCTELVRYSQSPIFVTRRLPFALSCTRTSCPKTAGRIEGHINERAAPYSWNCSANRIVHKRTPIKTRGRHARGAGPRALVVRNTPLFRLHHLLAQPPVSHGCTMQPARSSA